MKCLWNFYLAWFTDLKYLHFIAILELIFFLAVGIIILKLDKRPRKEAIQKLAIASLLSQIFVPLAETLIFCYPFDIAFVKNLILLWLMWFGVGIWLFIHSLRKRKMKNLKRKELIGKRSVLSEKKL